MLEINHLAFSYHRHPVLKDITFSVKEGEFVGIIGKNGCGKSTLLSILAGVQKPSAGTILYNGTPLFEKGKAPSLKIGYVPQKNPLLTELSVRDNLKLWQQKKDPEKTDALLEEMQLKDLLSTTVGKLSEGMKKRVSIASVLQNSPKILIMDESSASLDLPCKDIIHRQLTAFVSNGGCVIFTTHEETEFALCSSLCILKDGVLHPADSSLSKSDLVSRF